MKKALSLTLTALLVFSMLSVLANMKVSAAPQHPILLPFHTSWEDQDPAHGRSNSVDYGEDFYLPELGRVNNERPPESVFGFNFGDRQLKAAVYFSSSNAYCYFNLFDTTPQSDWGPPIKIRPHTIISIWYYHDKLANSMIDAQLYNKRTGEFDTLRDFIYTKRIDGYTLTYYVVDQNDVRIHPAYRYDDIVNSWQYASFDLSIIYEDDPENWYISKIWIGFDNRQDHAIGQARTYFDMLFMSYGVGEQQITTMDGESAYYNAWTTASMEVWSKHYTPDGNWNLWLKLMISGFNDGYRKDWFSGDPAEPIFPYKLRVSTDVSGAQAQSSPEPNGINLSDSDPSPGQTNEFFVMNVALLLLGAVPGLSPVTIGIEAAILAAEFFTIVTAADPEPTYEWPIAKGWFDHEIEAIPNLILGEVYILIPGLSNGTHNLSFTFEVDHGFTEHDWFGYYPAYYETESLTFDIEWSSTADYVDLPPDIPSKPSGETVGYIGESYDYTTSTNDPNGHDVCYEFDWDDGPTETTGLVNSGANATKSHIWTAPGTYNVTVRAEDSTGLKSDWSPSLTVTIFNNPPSKPRTPSGRESGYTGVSYSYNTSTSDPDGDDVYYEFDWDDGSTKEIGPCPSGANVSTTHIWSFQGVYNVTVKARDYSWAWSASSDILAVEIEKTGGPGGGGGGGTPVFDVLCPRLFVWNGSDYAEEFIFDLHGDSDVTMCRTVGQPLVPENDHYLLSLRELNQTISHIDYVRLYAVDAEGVMHECHLTLAVHSELGNVKQILQCNDDERITLGPSQTIDFKFNIPEVENIDYFIFEIQGYEPN